MSAAMRDPALGTGPERFNFDASLACPCCYRGAGSLSRSAADKSLYRCGGCSTRFRFEPANDVQGDTLVRFLWTEAEWNAGARIADDCFCPSCGARGHVVVCSRCTQDLYSGGRR